MLSTNDSGFRFDHTINFEAFEEQAEVSNWLTNSGKNITLIRYAQPWIKNKATGYPLNSYRWDNDFVRK